MIRTCAVLVAAGLSVLALVTGCGNDPTNPIVVRDPTPPAPRDNEEAEEIALWISDSLYAPEDLYQRVMETLTRLRSEYGSAVPQVNAVTFRPKWASGQLLMNLTTNAIEQIRSGTFTEFDSLNMSLGFASMDTTLMGSLRWVSLRFEGRLHPRRLVELYSDSPSVLIAEPNGLCCDGSTVYPWVEPDVITYLFREAWGDCLSGCTDQRFWYFAVTASAVELVGFWDPKEGPPPPWWEEARRAKDRYNSPGMLGAQVTERVTIVR